MNLTLTLFFFLGPDLTGTIVTATTSDFEDFVDMTFDTLVSEETKGGIPRPQSVQSMMECILRIVTGPQMQSVPVTGEKKGQAANGGLP